jgi:hypothetical protein
VLFNDQNRNKILQNIRNTASIWSAVAERSGDTAFDARNQIDAKMHFDLSNHFMNPQIPGGISQEFLLHKAFAKS